MPSKALLSDRGNTSLEKKRKKTRHLRRFDAPERSKQPFQRCDATLRRPAGCPRLLDRMAKMIFRCVPRCERIGSDGPDHPRRESDCLTWGHRRSPATKAGWCTSNRPSRARLSTVSTRDRGRATPGRSSPPGKARLRQEWLSARTGPVIRPAWRSTRSFRCRIWINQSGRSCPWTARAGRRRGPPRHRQQP